MHSVEPRDMIISEKSHFLNSNIFLHKSAHIDFTHQIQKEFSKFNYFYACSVKMRFGQKNAISISITYREKNRKHFFFIFK